MGGRIKRFFYFPLASYFKFFAQVQLFFWKPRIVVITGSSGKTTLLHLIQSQIKDGARYSYHANSAYGIPFDILELKRKDLLLSEWPYLFLSAPFKAFKKPYRENLYVVEADCDRPGEGKFLASLLNPEVTLWVSSSRTHSMNFDTLVENKKFLSVKEAIANEFGYFLEYTKDLAIVNGDSELITKETQRAKVPIKALKKKDLLQGYKVNANTTEFKIADKLYRLKALLPEETFYLLAMTDSLLDYLNLNIEPNYSKFQLPPGRSSLFKGIKGITIIDSSYNANLDSMTAMLKMFNLYPGEPKWAVLGDMIEQGKGEQAEHEKLAELIATVKLAKIILMGPRVAKYTYPKLKALLKGTSKIEKFLLPREVLDYLLTNIQGGETILFKGARFLEGVIEHLLIDRRDIDKLSRREKIWQMRRKKWEL